MKTSNQGPLEQAAGRAVRDYLEALRSGATGRRSSVDAVQRRLAEIRDELDGAPAIRRLKLVQERRELRRRLEHAEQAAGESPEDAFVAVAAVYSRRHHIAYATWREVGVPAAVLRRAGLKPAGRRRAPRR